MDTLWEFFTRILKSWPEASAMTDASMTKTFGDKIETSWAVWKRWPLAMTRLRFCDSSMTNPGNRDFWQADVGCIAMDGPSTQVGAKKAPTKEARCNAAFSCSLRVSDSCNGMDLYPSYTERACELDRALKWSRKALENQRSKAHFNWKAFL